MLLVPERDGVDHAIFLERADIDFLDWMDIFLRQLSEVLWLIGLNTTELQFLRKNFFAYYTKPARYKIS